MKKAISVLLALLLLLSLIGCAAKSMANGAAEDTSFPESAAEAPAASPAEPKMEYGWEEEAVEEEGGGEVLRDPAELAEKIIYSANLDLETTEFDQATAAIETLVDQAGGYIQFSSINGDTRYNEDGTTSVVNRYADYTVAVPSDRFEEFLKQSGNIGNVTYQSRNAENITSQYTDTEARLDSLQVQEERLLAMMESTSDLESLIALEERLSEVNYEIESYQRQLKDWDRRVAYSTVTLSLREVEIYTPTAPVVRTFGEKLGDSFSGGWKSFVWGLQSFALFLARSLPNLVLLAAVILAAVFGFRASHKRRASKKSSKQAKKPDNSDETP